MADQSNGQMASGAAQGALSGVAAGSAFGPWGMAIGGAIGAAGALGGAGLFGSSSKNYGYSKGDIEAMYDQRMSQIYNFKQELEGSQNTYLAQMNSLNSTAFNNFFGPNAITKMGAMGFDPSSGGTAAELARQAAMMQAGTYQSYFDAQQKGLMAVDQAMGGASSSRMGIAGQNYGVPQQNPVWGELGRFGGNLFMNELANRNRQPGTNPNNGPMNTAPTTMSNALSLDVTGNPAYQYHRPDPRFNY